MYQVLPGRRNSKTEDGAAPDAKTAAVTHAEPSFTISESSVTFEDLHTRNDEMQRCIELARTAAATTASVLIVGESGTGKDLLAYALHNASARREKPCILVNCASIPENLHEVELFGSEEGSHGTERMRRGKFELADGGTLILDEISALSQTAQIKVLRAIEKGKYERVGGENERQCDVRLIACTDTRLPSMVEEREFREDLYYRLNEVMLDVPPLRRRTEDLEMLMEHIIAECNQRFGKNVAGVSQIAVDYLYRYDFPGNVRELKSMLKRGVTVARGELLWMEDLGMRVEVPAEVENDGTDRFEQLSLAAVERRHIQQVLNLTGGNKKRTAEYLKISRPTLDRKIRMYKLNVP